MEDLTKIINKNIVQNKRLILKRNFFYSVKLIPATNKQVYLFKNWRLGLPGKYLFKSKFNEF